MTRKPHHPLPDDDRAEEDRVPERRQNDGGENTRARTSVQISPAQRSGHIATRMVNLTKPERSIRQIKQAR